MASYPTYQNSGTGVLNQTSTIALGYPSSIQAGDLLILLANSVVGGYSINVPSGFTSFYNGLYGGSSQAGYLFCYKIADGTEAGTISVTRTGGGYGINDNFLGRIFRYAVDNKKINIETSNTDLDTNGTADWGALSINGMGRTIISAIVSWTLDDTLIADKPASYTSRGFYNGGGGNFLTVAIADKENVSSAGAQSVSIDPGTTYGWVTMHLSIFSPAGRSFIVN